MTISSVVRKAGPFAGNSAATTFPFAFKVFDKTNVKALLVNATGTSTTLVLDSDYSVILSADQNANPGGSITYPITGVPLPIGYSLVLLGDLPYDQETKITNSGGFYPSVIEDMSDRSTIQIQQLAEIASRAIVYNEAESVSPVLPTAAARANGVLGFDALGQLEVFPLPASVGAGDLKNEAWTDGTDYISGTSTSVTLSRPYALKANLGSVVMQGIAQDPGTYSLNGLTLTFLDGNGNPTPIPAGVGRIWCIGGTTLSISVTPDNSVTDAKVALGSKLFNRVNNLVDVNDFPGVDKTGVSDSTAGMQAAHNTGKLVYYPAGTYKFSNVTIAAGGIVGDGQSLSILLSSDLTAADLLTFTGTGSQSPAMFKDFTIQASLSKTQGAALRFNAPSGQLTYPNITNVQSLNVPTGIYFSNSAQFVIDQCNFINYSAQGVHIENNFVSDSGDSSISNCFFNTSVVTGTTYGIWHRSGGGLKITNVKFLGGNSCYVMGWIGGTGAADLSITNCSFEDTTAYGIFIGRDSGTGNVGSVTIFNNEFGCPNNIATDTSGLLTLMTIGGNVINQKATAGYGIALNNVSNFAILPNVLNAQFGGAPVAIAIAANCSNGKIAPQVYVGFLPGNCLNVFSTTVFVEGTTQGGPATVTVGIAYGALFVGTATIGFPTAYAITPEVDCRVTGTATGGVSAFASNISTAGFTLNVIGITNGGVVPVTWSARGVL